MSEAPDSFEDPLGTSSTPLEAHAQAIHMGTSVAGSMAQLHQELSQALSQSSEDAQAHRPSVIDHLALAKL
jgi:hypothetical protein